MHIKQVLRILILLLLILINVSCDQISKQVARNNLSYYQEVHVIKNHFVLTKVENSGAFLSVGNNLPTFIKLIFLAALPCLVLAYGLYYLIKNKNAPLLFSTGIAFAIGGGIGNIYDRIRHGSVTDFMHIDFLFIKTGIFNMADVSIMIGMFLILLSFWLKKKLEQTTSINSSAGYEEDS